jgi:hypothetical protein
MERQRREIKKWWSSPEEEKLAIDELRIALDKQEHDNDYRKKIHESAIKLVDEVGSNENFQKMIIGLFTPPICIEYFTSVPYSGAATSNSATLRPLKDNSYMQDELAKLLETTAASKVSTLHK